jgi:hypothetical protein
MRARAAFLFLILVGGDTAPALAQYHDHGGPHPGGGGWSHNGGGWHGNHPGPDAWRRGNWRHEWHDGRFGWWWSVGPSWYSFNAPVYPYPAYVPPPVEVVPAPPPLVQVPPPVVVQPPAPGPAPSQFWYYCRDPQGYYPYVSSCNGPWQEVGASQSR